MPSRDQSVMFIASRAPIMATMIALVTGTVLVAVSMARLATATFLAERFQPAMIGVLALGAAVVIFLCYLDVRCLLTVRNPRRLTISHAGFTEVQGDQVWSETWENLKDPEKKTVSLGGGGLMVCIAFQRPLADPLLLRVDIYGASFNDILPVVEDAMAGRAIIKPVRPNQTGMYLVVAFAAILSIAVTMYVMGR